MATKKKREYIIRIENLKRNETITKYYDVLTKISQIECNKYN